MSVEESRLDKMRERAPEFIRMLGGRLQSLDSEEQRAVFEFNVSTDFCHTVDVIQGGFVTAMLDAAMSHACAGCSDDVVGVSSLEIKTSYIAVSRAGACTAEGYVVRASHKTAFLEGRLYNAAGELTATASSVAKLVRRARSTT